MSSALLSRKRSRLVLIAAAVLAALLAAALFGYLHARRRQVLVVTAATLVLRDFPTGPGAGAAPNPVLLVITPGSPFQIREIRRRDDVEAVRISIATDLDGWVITGPSAYLTHSR